MKSLKGLIALLCLVLVATACGDGDESESTTASVETTAQAENPSDPTGTVNQLQTDLAELGYYDGPIDGVYGTATEEAVREFQAFAGIEEDGIYGPTTGTAVAVAVGRPGATSSLQTALTTLCYYRGPIDGDYGEQTTEAVLAFQKDAGVPEDGLYGPATADALVAAWPSRPSECEENLGSGTAAIAAIVDGETIPFRNDVSCELGPDDTGMIAATAEDGTTLAFTLDGTATRLVIDGPTASYDGDIDNVSSSGTLMTITADGGAVALTVPLSQCNQS